MKSHFLISESDGGLYDTRTPNWSERPLRPDYSRTFRQIETVVQLKATLRAGGFTFPGGYPLYFIASDGEALAFETVRKEFRQVADSIHHGINDGWRVVGCEINYEDSELVCSHSGDKIAPAYEEAAQ